jgi:hypothetical protein
LEKRREKKSSFVSSFGFFLPEEENKRKSPLRGVKLQEINIILEEKEEKQGYFFLPLVFFFQRKKIKEKNDKKNKSRQTNRKGKWLP